MKIILLTGIAGFIGFHVALALKKRGDFVVGIDNFNTYYSAKLKEARASILKAKGIEIIEGDINNQNLLRKLFETYSPTDLLNLAAQAGVRYSFNHPDVYLKSNINGFLSILEVLRYYPNVKLTYASSSSVYGRNQKTPFSVFDMTDQPANLYAVTKKTNELMAYAYHHLYGIPMTGLRFFTVYGPWGRPDMAYYAFTKAMLNGKPIHLFNEGKMQRDFTYIDDIVDGTLAAIDYQGKCEIFNLGSHHPIDLLTFISLLENALGIKAIKIFKGSVRGEVNTTYADLTYSEEKLGFIPKISLEEGLSHFIAWYRKDGVDL
ncbi:MAG: NAD-dependent epimerase/dehydratase family protein [Chlamydiales bacterium]